jgi:hypothetical protein
MGFFSWLRTSEKAINTTTDLVDAGVRGIDALFFTEEEKSVASQKTLDTWLETQRVLINENTAKSITRRILACMIVGSFMLQSFIAIGLYRLDKEWSQMVLDIMKAEGTLVATVAFFYFGYYGVKQIIGK